jgi:hypothetical protein
MHNAPLAKFPLAYDRSLINHGDSGINVTVFWDRGEQCLKKFAKTIPKPDTDAEMRKIVATTASPGPHFVFQLFCLSFVDVPSVFVRVRRSFRRSFIRISRSAKNS